MALFADDGFALAVCDRCGRQVRHQDAVLEAQTHLRVHAECADASMRRRRLTPDPEALRWVRLDYPMEVAPPFPLEEGPGAPQNTF